MGYLPKQESLVQESRYLGLDFSHSKGTDALEELTGLMEKYIDYNRLLEETKLLAPIPPVSNISLQEDLKISVACNSESFSFIYQEHLDVLCRLGTVILFNPEDNRPLPEGTDLLYLPGGYPEKHYEAPSMEEDLHWLKHKVEQGADALISQLFFDNDAFYRFMDAADQKGITVPIHAGIMPITSAKMINTTINLSGASIPKALSDLIATYGENPSDMRKAGIEYAARQINDLAEQGMHYVHIYTMNHSETAKEICGLIK